MSLKFSLITTTRYRTQEIRALLQSLVECHYPKQDYEIIICDQNLPSEARVVDVLDEFRDKLNIKYMAVEPRGTGFSRQQGILHAKGAYLAFPDDDCMFYPDTLERTEKFFIEHPDVDLVSGKVFHRDTNKNIFKSWPSHRKSINFFNFYKLYTCVSIFAKNIGVGFDPDFGIGAAYGSGEDADFVFQYLKRGCKLVYEPSIHMWHPEMTSKEFTIEKIRTYSFGFGALCRKDLNFPIFLIFCAGMALQTLRLIAAFIRGSKEDAVKNAEGFRYRLRGFLNYRKA